MEATGELVERVIAAFSERHDSDWGSLSRMARAMGLSVSTVQGWRVKGRIPRSRNRGIADAATREKVELPQAFLDLLPSTNSSSTVAA